MKTTTVALSVLMMTTLSACGNGKKTVGPQGPPPPNTGVPSPTQQGGPTGQGGANAPGGGVNSGPEPIKSGDANVDDSNVAKNPGKNPDDSQDSKDKQDGDDSPATDDRGSDTIASKGSTQKPSDSSQGGLSTGRPAKGAQGSSGGSVARPSSDDIPEIVPPSIGSTKKPAKPAPAKPKVNRRWEAPTVIGTPAEAWLTRQLNPLVKTMSVSGPRARSLKDRVRITIALGYFDGYDAGGAWYDGENYGRHAAVDPFLWAMVDEILTRPCESDRLQVCDFETIASNDIETIYRRAGVDDFIEEVRLVSGALNVSYAENTGPDREAQLDRSQRVEELFSKSFADSDLVVYVGHSREGGGPDFRPPVLDSKGHVNYAAYKKTRVGAQRVVKAVRSHDRKAASLMLASCDSTEHFLGEIRKAGPDVEIGTVRGILHAEDLLGAGLASVEMYLRQGSIEGLASVVAGRPKLAQSIDVRLPSNSK